MTSRICKKCKPQNGGRETIPITQVGAANYHLLSIAYGVSLRGNSYLAPHGSSVSTIPSSQIAIK